MRLEQIKKYLKSHDCYEDFVGRTPHPGREPREVYALNLFARTPKLLDDYIAKFEGLGYKVYIEGSMDDIPAAYLYKELR